MRRSSKEEKYDLYKGKKWLFLISGFGESRTALYTVYISIIFVILIYIMSMAFYAIYLVVPNKVLIIIASHVAMISIFSTGVILSRLITDRSLKITNTIINSGIYDYEDEEVDEKQWNLRSQISKEIEKTSNLFLMLFSSGGISNLTVFPITQLMFYTETGENTILNPYLPPYLFYMPFNTRTVEGYCLAYFLNVLLVVTTYGITLCFLLIYIHCTVQLKVHLKILNYSLKNIHKRAFSMYKKRTNMNHSKEGLFEKKEFQNCLYSCFKSNVKHHQALIRFKRALQPFNGACLLDIYIMIALIYAAVFYLILQKLPINYLVNFVVMLFAEQSDLFIICVLGETITHESGKLLRTLYSIPWIHCNKKFNKAVSIMMCNSLEPFEIKALLIHSPANLKAYGDFIMAMYKIMNLLRHSDKTK